MAILKCFIITNISLLVFTAAEKITIDKINQKYENCVDD